MHTTEADTLENVDTPSRPAPAPATTDAEPPLLVIQPSKGWVSLQSGTEQQ